MTEMSEFHAFPPRPWPPKRSESRGGTSLARAVQARRAIVQIATLLTLTGAPAGCVIPPSLQVVDDAAVNSPPAIALVSSDRGPLAQPGPVPVDRGATAGNLHFQLIDTDLSDILYVRIYVNYNLPDRMPARAGCTATSSASASAMRTATCDLSGLCATNDVGVRQNMSIVVFDRMPVDRGADPQAMVSSDGLSTSQFYFLDCQPPQT